MMSASALSQAILGLMCYVIMGLLFCTARRRNGFAALQDLLSGTRVVSRAALSARPALGPPEAVPPAVESAAAVGPYHVLQPLAEADGTSWLLGYDLRLLRKVWIRVVPQGTEPFPAHLRSLGRIGRLRWLTGKRTPEENWDAFEALAGRPLLELARTPQPWSEVRYWLHDLAGEISAAEKDGTLPALALDRVWIAADGRAKLLDFPVPGLVVPACRQPSTPNSVTPAPLAAGNSTAFEAGAAFLSTVASLALGSGLDAQARSQATLPLHARAFLKSLPQSAGAAAVASALKPLLNRVAAVSRLRRAAMVAGCVLFPLLACVGGLFAMTFMQDFSRRNAGVMELGTLLQLRTSARLFGSNRIQYPGDRLAAIYIAHHFRSVITNDASWSHPLTLALIKGEARKFVQQSLVDYPVPTPEEIQEADAALEKVLPKELPFGKEPPAGLPAMVVAATLLFYVGLPALVAAVLFRGGVVLLIAGVTYVRKDGQPASRLRLLWRALLTWGPALLVFVVSGVALSKPGLWWPGWLALVIFGLLAALSLALPTRGLQDRLAGTWPVAR